MSDMDAQNPYYDHDYRELPHSFSFCADSLVGVGRCSLPVISRQAVMFYVALRPFPARGVMLSSAVPFSARLRFVDFSPC